MKKLLLFLLVGLVLATAASYFGMQWKVKQSTDEFFQSMAFLDANYESVAIDVSGQIVLQGISMFVPMTQSSIDIDRISLVTGSFLDTLSMEKNVKEGKLPQQLKLNVQGFSMDIDSGLVNLMQGAYQPGTSDQIFALGCGRNRSIGPKQYYEMGFRNLTFDMNLGYSYDPTSDELVSTFDFYLNGMSQVNIHQTYLGLYPLMQDYQSAMVSFDPSSVKAVNFNLEYVDIGYNAKWRDYCSRESGMDKDEWQELNNKMIASVLDRIDFESSFDAMAIYAELTKERSRVNLNLTPLPGFNMTDLEFYDVSKLIELLNLNVVLNNNEVDVQQVSWDSKSLKALDVSSIRQAFRVVTAEEEAQEKAAEKPKKSRILKNVPIGQLEGYLHRQVLLERKDGKQFIGELVSTSAEKIVVRTRFRTGFTDLPLVRSEIAVAKVYPEN